MKRAFLVLIAALAGCGGDNPAATAPFLGPPLPRGSGSDVQGTVVNRFEEPVAGARVRIGAAPAVTTDPQGRFLVRGVGGTYDAAVVVDDPVVQPGFPAVSRAVVYQRLGRRDPVLYLPRLRFQPGSGSHSTDLQSITTSGFSGVPLFWAFTNPSGFVATGAVTGSPMNFLWNGPADAVNVGSLIAMIGSPSQGLLAAGHVPLTAGNAAVSATVPTTALRTVKVSGASRPPPGCAVVSHDVVVPASDGTSLTVATFFPNAGRGVAANLDMTIGFTDEVPLSLHISATCLPSFSATSVVARRLSLEPTTVDIDVPAPPVIKTPPPGGTASAASPLAWTAPFGSVSVVHFDRLESDGFTSGTLDVVTASSATAFPDLTALGAKVVPGLVYLWRVEAWGGLTGTDAFASRPGFGALLAGIGNFSQAVSESSLAKMSP